MEKLIHVKKIILLKIMMMISLQRGIVKSICPLFAGDSYELMLEKKDAEITELKLNIKALNESAKNIVLSDGNYQNNYLRKTIYIFI